LGGPLPGRDHREGSPACGRGKRGDQKEQALGYSQGGFSTKVHLRSEGDGKPMVFFLSEGQRNEMVGFWALMEGGEVKGESRGRPRLRPRRICADKGYAKGVVRRYLRGLGIRITIARRSNEHRGGPFDREIYRTRNRIERLINRLKHFRRVATRYEKRAENYRAMLTIAAIKLWL
jgi:transposase